MTHGWDLGNKKNLLQDGWECDYGPYYQCSNPLQSLNLDTYSILISILVKKVGIKQGTLHYHCNDENKCVNVSENYKIYFNATILKKVNTKCCGAERYHTKDDFYLAFYKLLTGRKNLRLPFHFEADKPSWYEWWNVPKKCLFILKNLRTRWHIWCC